MLDREVSVSRILTNGFSAPEVCVEITEFLCCVHEVCLSRTRPPWKGINRGDGRSMFAYLAKGFEAEVLGATDALTVAGADTPSRATFTFLMFWNTLPLLAPLPEDEYT